MKNIDIVELVLKGNFLIVSIISFIIVVFPLIGFDTIKTLIFESNGGDKVKYEQCVDWDYDDSGGFCVEREFRYTSFEARVSDHFRNAMSIWIWVFIFLVAFNLSPKINNYYQKFKPLKKE